MRVLFHAIGLVGVSLFASVAVGQSLTDVQIGNGCNKVITRDQAKNIKECIAKTRSACDGWYQALKKQCDSQSPLSQRIDSDWNQAAQALALQTSRDQSSYNSSAAGASASCAQVKQQRDEQLNICTLASLSCRQVQIRLSNGDTMTCKEIDIPGGGLCDVLSNATSGDASLARQEQAQCAAISSIQSKTAGDQQ